MSCRLYILIVTLMLTKNKQQQTKEEAHWLNFTVWRKNNEIDSNLLGRVDYAIVCNTWITLATDLVFSRI